MAHRVISKLIVVEVRSHRHGDAAWRYRSDLERFRTSHDEGDLELIIKVLCSKRPSFAPMFNHPKCSFAIKEPDNSLVEIGINSPITETTAVVCTLPKEDVQLLINKADRILYIFLNDTLVILRFKLQVVILLHRLSMA